jgi:hypothetical protein
VSRTSTAFPRLTVPALPRIKLTSETCFNDQHGKQTLEIDMGVQQSVTQKQHPKAIE